MDQIAFPFQRELPPENRLEGNCLKTIGLDDSGWSIEATFEALTNSCPYCQGPLELHQWLKSRSPYLDSPYLGRPVRIYVTRQRSKCLACKRTSTADMPDFHDRHRVTTRLMQYLPRALWSELRLKSVAKSVGASPALLRNLLLEIARDAESRALRTSTIGIHEVTVGNHVHLLASDLKAGVVIAFFPSGSREAQFLLLSDFIKNRASNASLEITCPARTNILRVVSENHKDANVFCSKYSFHALVATRLASATKQWSRRGRSGSISCREALKIASCHASELPSEYQKQFQRGLDLEDPFWNAYSAKERLFQVLRQSPKNLCFQAAISWYGTLPPREQIIFGPTLSVITEIRQYGMEFSFDPLLIRFEKNLRVFERLLIKPGVKFSDEMLAALFLSIPVTHVIIPEKMGTNRFFSLRQGETISSDRQCELGPGPLSNLLFWVSNAFEANEFS